MSVAIIVDVTDVINVLLGTGFLLQLDLVLFLFSITALCLCFLPQKLQDTILIYVFIFYLPTRL